ncbi:hypothetical protein BB560_001258 [Smittium megazygosporum]|uniref:GPI transamidase component PIG-T n=1 Tax=Smittium megazygosporum TaxID=133381 RepID=A0A2T9ZI27_9FUNG|nr:hypothetical protein BB560_001258 [Smittium megazygosporum]
MELRLNLEPESKTVVTFDYEKSFIKLDEHPPDPNRGFNIEPTALTFNIDNDITEKNGSAESKAVPLSCTLSRIFGQTPVNNVCKVTVYSELFVAVLPTPDFSMPYNVITFTCTLLALYYGKLFSLLSKNIVHDKE